jgi:hypothetical protein
MDHDKQIESRAEKIEINLEQLAMIAEHRIQRIIQKRRKRLQSFIELDAAQFLIDKERELLARCDAQLGGAMIDIDTAKVLLLMGARLGKVANVRDIAAFLKGNMEDLLDEVLGDVEDQKRYDVSWSVKADLIGATQVKMMPKNPLIKDARRINNVLSNLFDLGTTLPSDQALA